MALVREGTGLFYVVLLPPLFSPARMRLSKNWQIGGGGRGGVGIGLIILFILSGFCGDSHVAVRESRGEDFIFARRHSTLQTGGGGGGGGKDTSFPMQETQK